MQDFRDIKVWRRAHAIVLRIYALTAQFPSEERYGLVQQLKRAAVSVPTNIAEGAKRIFRRDYARFLNIAEGSLREVEYLVVLSADLELCDSADTADLLTEIERTSRMLASLRKAVQRADPSRGRRSERLPPDANP